jgi:hypothetical protein
MSMARTVDSAVPTVSTGSSFSLGVQRIDRQQLKETRQ